MEIREAVQRLGALAHETRLSVFRLLVRRGPLGLPAGEIATQDVAADQSLQIEDVEATTRRRDQVAEAQPPVFDVSPLPFEALAKSVEDIISSARTAATAEELVEAPVVEKVVKAPRDLSGAGRILFVEDEAAVRGIAARLLRQRGYEVIEAADGEEALLLAEEHAGQIDMLISDVIMPGLDGPSLLKKARPYLGDAPVMFISGYAEAEFSNLLEGEENISFLPKPIDIKTLAERVKQELQKAA